MWRVLDLPKVKIVPSKEGWSFKSSLGIKLQCVFSQVYENFFVPLF